MTEGIWLATILIVAVALVVRPWYRAISGKEHGCAGCPGASGQACSCSDSHAGATEGGGGSGSCQDSAK
jgi:hypothetical protein